MPELPNTTIYLEALDGFIVGRTLQNIVVRSPFVVRTVNAEIGECHGQKIRCVSRIGKRIVGASSTIAIECADTTATMSGLTYNCARMCKSVVTSSVDRTKQAVTRSLFLFPSGKNRESWIPRLI